MDLITIVQIVFAVTASIAALSVAASALDRLGRRALLALAVLLGLVAVGAWVVFGLRPHSEFAVVAGGVTLAFAAQLVAVRLRRLLRVAGQVDEQLGRAQARLHALVAREAEERAVELERALARARADSISLLAEQERRLAEERRTAAAERSRVAGDELSEALTAAQRQIEARFNAWTDDLERAQHAVVGQLAQLAQRQKQIGRAHV